MSNIEPEQQRRPLVSVFICVPPRSRTSKRGRALETVGGGAWGEGGGAGLLLSSCFLSFFFLSFAPDLGNSGEHGSLVTPG